MKIRKFMTALIGMGMILAAAACGNSSGEIVTGRYHNPAQQTEESDTGGAEGQEGTEAAQKEELIGTDQFMIIGNDMQSGCLILEQIASGKQYMYYYSMTTSFLDKYGNRAAVSYFEPGRVVVLGSKDSQGRVMQIQVSDQVWEYPDVTKYSVDEERGIFQIAENRYSYDDTLYVNSDGNPQRLSDLNAMDTLRVVGAGTKILSVSVTTGHGILALSNTELFEGSFIQIGGKIFSEITEDMKLEVPEGVYTVAVANNGYGGDTEVEIKRGQTVQLDLDTLKGEGPKYGNILFAVDVTNAILQIDGNPVDYSQVVPLKYGVHTLTVTADSYEPYSKNLYVNSEEATVIVRLTGEGSTSASTETSEKTDSSGTKTESGTDSSSKSGSLAGSLAGSHAGGSSTGSSSSSTSGMDEATLNTIVDEMLGDEKSSDYLSTLSTLLSALTGSSDGT